MRSKFYFFAFPDTEFYVEFNETSLDSVYRLYQGQNSGQCFVIFTKNDNLTYVL